MRQRARRSGGAAEPTTPTLLVKVYGRDAWDSQAVGSSVDALTRRGEIPHLGRGRQSRVEHEALATVLAERAGCRVLPLVAVGRSEQGDALIVTVAAAHPVRGPDGRPGRRRPCSTAPGRRSPPCTPQACHMGGSTARHVVVRADGARALADLADAELNADEGDKQVDSARLLVTHGAHRRHRPSPRSPRCAASGRTGLVDVLPYLQPAALGRRTRQEVEDGRTGR